MPINERRLKELLIKTFEYTLNAASMRNLKGLIRKIDISHSELEALGYDRKNYKDLHDAVF